MAYPRLFIFYELVSSRGAEPGAEGGEIAMENAVMFGIMEGADPRDALERLMSESPWLRGHECSTIVVREAGEPSYL